MKLPHFQIGQTVITLSSLVVALSKLSRANDHGGVLLTVE